MFSGYGGEIIYRPFFANYAIGAEIWDVRQRDYDMLFSNLDYKIVTGHLNYYYTFPTSQVTFALKGEDSWQAIPVLILIFQDDSKLD